MAKLRVNLHYRLVLFLLLFVSLMLIGVKTSEENCRPIRLIPLCPRPKKPTTQPTLPTPAPTTQPTTHATTQPPTTPPLTTTMATTTRTQPPPTTTTATTTTQPPTTTQPLPTTTTQPPTTTTPPFVTTTTTPQPDCGPWYLVYEHDNQGNAVNGSKAVLINKVKNGADVRVAISRDDIYVTSVQNTYHIGDNLCAQALFHISKADYDRFQNKAYWWFVNCCTSGHFQMSRYYVGVHTLKTKNQARYGLKWFVRDAATTHLVSLDDYGGVTAGNKSNVINAIQQGHGVRINTLESRYSFPADVLEYNAANDLAAATALWHVSQEDVTRDGVTVKDFKGNDYWWFALFTTNSNMQVTRWHVGAHTQPTPPTSASMPRTSWFADPCWEEIYKHNAPSHIISGSGVNLVRLIRAGHRVKVLFRGILLEADEIRIRKGHVCVSLLNDLSKSVIDTFDANMSWRWRQACTTGRLETLEYQVGAYVQTNSSIESDTMTWFVDSQRTWRKVLSVAANGTVISGAKADLIAAIRNGAEVRYNLLLDNQDTGLASLSHQADSIAIKGGEVGVSHIRSVSVAVDELSNWEIKFQHDQTSSPYWRFTILATTGRLDMSRWIVGEHRDRGHTSQQIAADWFVNEAL